MRMGQHTLYGFELILHCSDGTIQRSPLIQLSYAVIKPSVSVCSQAAYNSSTKSQPSHNTWLISLLMYPSQPSVARTGHFIISPLAHSHSSQPLHVWSNLQEHHR